MSEVLQGHLPDWLTQPLMNEARYAVQIFLVIGGFLAAQTASKLFARRHDLTELHVPLQLMWQRYTRLGKPFWVAVTLAALISLTLARIPALELVASKPQFTQWLSHLLLVHDIAGVEALSAGVWYVAIDFQLFALLILMTWVSSLIGQKTNSRATPWLMLMATGMGTVSLFWLNTDSTLDAWGIYFFGSYMLGMWAFWAREQGKPLLYLTAMVLLVDAALTVAWRERLLLAGGVSLLLMVRPEVLGLQRVGQSAVVKRLSDISYSVFLIHYPISLLVSAAMNQWGDDSLGLHATVFASTWVTSLLAGSLLYDWVEARTFRLPRIRPILGA